MKIQEDYRDIDDVIRMCMTRIRVPEDWYGDYLGMIGAARVGERELLRVGDEVGWDAFDRLRRRLVRLQRGAHARDDPDAARPARAPDTTSTTPCRCRASRRAFRSRRRSRWIPRRAEIEIDLRNNPDCLPCGLNLTESTSNTSALIGVFNSIDHTVPRNAGSARAVKVLLRENCVVGIPVHPASCSMATSGIAERLAGIVQRTLAEFADGMGMASTGPECPPAVAGLSGRDPRHGNAPFVDMMILGNSGGAGHASR